MTHSAIPPDQPLLMWLEQAVRAVGRGHFRFLLVEDAPVAVCGEVASRLGAALRATAYAMYLQAIGHVAEAVQQLEIAAQLLPPEMQRRSERSGGMRAVLRLPSSPDLLSILMWRTAQVVWREQAEVADLAMRLRARPEPPDVLVMARIEMLRWVDHDPWACAGPVVDGEPPGCGHGRAETCARATALRQLVRPTEGDISPMTWKKSGGYGGVLRGALLELASSELTPWASPNPVLADLPVRLGRLRAWQRAVHWKNDLQFP